MRKTITGLIVGDLTGTDKIQMPVEWSDTAGPLRFVEGWCVRVKHAVRWLDDQGYTVTLNQLEHEGLITVNEFLVQLVWPPTFIEHLQTLDATVRLGQCLES